jgi:hypothetical protein
VVLDALQTALPGWTVTERDEQAAARLAHEGYSAEQVVAAIREIAARPTFPRSRVHGLAYFAKSIREDLEPAGPAAQPAADDLPPLPDVPLPMPVAEPASPERALWLHALGQIQLQVTPADFDTWIRGTTVVSHTDNHWVIGAPHAFAREWLENRLRNLVKKTLIGLVGGPVEVEFVDMSAVEQPTSVPGGVEAAPAKADT